MSSISAQYVVFFHYLRQLIQVASSNGIDIMPLKGAHLLTAVYNPGETRDKLADVDILVRNRDWLSILELMKQQGFQNRNHFINETLRHEKGLLLNIGPGHDLLFEVHRNLFDGNRFPIDCDGIWKRSYESHFEGVPCLRMADEDVFCHLAWHSAGHRFMHHKRTLGDLKRVLTRVSFPDRATQAADGTNQLRDENSFQQLIVKIEHRAAEWHCTRVVWLYLELLRNQLQEGVSKESLAQLNRTAHRLAPPMIAQKGLLSLIGRGHTTLLSSMHHRVQAAIIWPFVFDSLQSMVRMIRTHPRFMYPPVSPNENEDESN